MSATKNSKNAQFSLAVVFVIVSYVAAEVAICFGSWDPDSYLRGLASTALLQLFVTANLVVAWQREGKLQAFCIGCLVPALTYMIGVNIFEADLTMLQHIPRFQELAVLRATGLSCGAFGYWLSGLYPKSESDQP